MDRETRLVLWNQFEILKHLNAGQAAEYEARQDIVGSGYTLRYDELFSQVSEHEKSAGMQQEVLDTLDMFRALNNAKRNGWVPSDPAAVNFGGFDGNNDEHYFFASYLIDTRGLFQESAPNKNSHTMTSAPHYRRMVASWKQAAHPYQLTPAEAEAVIQA